MLLYVPLLTVFFSQFPPLLIINDNFAGTWHLLCFYMSETGFFFGTMSYGACLYSISNFLRSCYWQTLSSETWERGILSRLRTLISAASLSFPSKINVMKSWCLCWLFFVLCCHMSILWPDNVLPKKSNWLWSFWTKKK